MKKSIQYVKPLILLLITAVALSSCKKDEAKTQVQAEKLPIIRVATAKQDSIQQKAEFPATIFANREANLGASLPGKIEKFYFPEGSFVQKGDLLVDLSAEAYTQALIELNAIEKDFERVSRLREKGSISEMEYDHLKAKLDASQVKTDMLRKHTQVVAPFSGMIVEYLMEEGENYFFNINLEPGYSNTSGILRLMQLNPMKAEIQVGENDLNRFYTGQNIEIFSDAVPNQIITGRVSYIKPILSTMTHTGTVEIEFSNPKLKFKPGMYATCQVDLGGRSGVFIPIDAIIRQAGTAEDFVFCIENDTAKRTTIKRIATQGEWVMVDSLEVGTVVATKGKNNLHHGVKVEIKEN